MTDDRWISNRYIAALPVVSIEDPAGALKQPWQVIDRSGGHPDWGPPSEYGSPRSTLRITRYHGDLWAIFTDRGMYLRVQRKDRRLGRPLTFQTLVVAAMYAETLTEYAR